MRALITTIVAAGLLALAPACKRTAATTPPELHYPWPVEKAAVADVNIAYAEVGSGDRTIVLIHGLGSYMPVWKNNVAALARNNRVIAIDLPGYGKSDRPEASYSMKWFAQQVRGLLASLGVDKPVLVGHSMGGQIAMTYALEYPDNVEGLVLTSPAGLETFGDGEAKWLATAVSAAFTCGADDEAIYVRHVQNFHKYPKSAEFMVDDRIAMRSQPDFEDYCRAVSRSVAGMLDQPVHDRIADLDLPVLVLFGKSDNLIPNPILHGGSTVRLAKREVELFKDADLVLLDKAGHMAQFERADEWNQEVLDFLRRLGEPPVPTPTPSPAAAESTPAAAPTPQPEPQPAAPVEAGPTPDDAAVATPPDESPDEPVIVEPEP